MSLGAAAELWQDDRVSLSLLYTIGVAVLVISLCVFVAAFKFALVEATSHEQDLGGLPRAELYKAHPGSNNRWHRGAGRQHLLKQVHLLQAGLVAFGITAVFFMILCMTAICVAVAAGSM